MQIITGVLMGIIALAAGCDDLHPGKHDDNRICFDIPYYDKICFYFSDPEYSSREIQGALMDYQAAYYKYFQIDIDEYLRNITISFWNDFEWQGCVRCAAVARDPYNLWIEIPFGWEPIGKVGFFWHLNHCVLWQLYGDPGFGEHSTPEYPWKPDHTKMIHELNRMYGG
jgi:hypothetical protein